MARIDLREIVKCFEEKAIAAIRRYISVSFWIYNLNACETFTYNVVVASRRE